MSQTNSDTDWLTQHFIHGPNNGSKDAELAILRALAATPEKRAYLMDYLAKQGLPRLPLVRASATSLVSAYCHKPYLLAWRKRVNPYFGLLEDTSEDDTGTSAAETSLGKDASATPPTAPQAGPSAPVDADKILSAIAPKLADLLAAHVQREIGKAAIELSPEAKAQIRTLAAQAAQERIDANAKPRVIEVHNTDNGTIKAIGLQHECFPTLLRAMQARDHRGFRLNIWLTGPTGSGKTTAAENAARALDLAFGTDGSLDADYKVLGFRDANGNIISTQFLDIYEHGGVYVADEIDNWLPSALLSLNAALANGFATSPKGLISRHPDACVIACANTWGLGATIDYVGRAKQDAASLDRFQPKINWPIDEALELAVAEAQDDTFGPMWHQTVIAARRAARIAGLKIIISPRATFAGIALLRSGFDTSEVIDMTFGAGLSPEQMSIIHCATAAIVSTARELRA